MTRAGQEQCRRSAILRAWIIDTQAVVNEADELATDKSVQIVALHLARAPNLVRPGSSKDPQWKDKGSGLGANNTNHAAADKGWGPKSDVLCWHCCHGFDHPGLPLPIAYDSRQDLFKVLGNFCSFSCMKAFNLDRHPGHRASVIADVITLFKKRCTGELGRIVPAPPRLLLRCFGGSMSIDEFRQAPLNSEIFSVLPPKMLAHQHIIERALQRGSVKQTLSTATVSFENSAAPGEKGGGKALSAAAAAAAQKDQQARQGAREGGGGGGTGNISFPNAPTSAKTEAGKIFGDRNETLRLKRPKPLQQKHLLERTMGISTIFPTL